MDLLIKIENIAANRAIGNKARGLKKLQRQHFPIPSTWVIPAEMRKQREEQPQKTDQQLLEAIEHQINPGIAYAVRSSGELEDGTNHSYAGQFATVLNVTGAAQILDAVHQVWASAGKTGHLPYDRNEGHGNEPHDMAVIIQEMVNVQWSGVTFSINPVTGRNETVIEAVRGTGDQLVQGGITPERWVHHQGTWEEFDRSSAPPQEILDELVSGVQKLRRAFGGEVDVEWGWDGKKLWYLQCRSVTSQTFPTIYSNHISREVLPGMIKPLVWSINIPVVNSAWLRLLGGMLGKLDIRPESLSRSFYYRAYFNMGTLGELFRRMGLPRDSLESLMGRKDPSGKSSFKPGWTTMKYLPRMLWFVVANLNLGKKFRKKIIELDLATDGLKKELSAAGPEHFRTLFDRLHALSREAAYWNIIIPLTMQITNRLLQRKMEKKGEDFSKVDFSAAFPELLKYDPQYHLASLANSWRMIPEKLRKSISVIEDLEKHNGHPSVAAFSTDLQAMIEKFGHFSESGNDFSSEPWQEHPGFLLDMVRNREKESQSFTSREMVNIATNNNKRKAYRRAGHYRVYREMISSSYTRTYGLFRNLFLITGRYFASQGILDRPHDVFYLTLEEHNFLLEVGAKDIEDGKALNDGVKDIEDGKALNGGVKDIKDGQAMKGNAKDINGGLSQADVQEIRKKVLRIKSEMERFADISLPSVIYGETPPPIATPNETSLEGIAVSPGIFEGEIVVVKGYKDFNKKVKGMILVIPFSDVGWTPILSHAGAIVTESGGMLSHASIIARELGIPAISSVDHACRIKDGTYAKIDGYNGMLTLEK